jgi:hypothetical protein
MYNIYYVDFALSRCFGTPCYLSSTYPFPFLSWMRSTIRGTANVLFKQMKDDESRMSPRFQPKW